MTRFWYGNLCCVMLVAITASAYAGVFHNNFVDYDDNGYVTNNPVTQAGLTRDGFVYAWTTFDLGNWIPLTVLSYQLDAELYGLSSPGFHGTNLALHCVNVLLLFCCMLRFTGHCGRSFAVTMLFGIHPLHVESVAWVAERKDVLSAFFLLVSLVAYERYASQLRIGPYLITVMTFVCGLLSKSMIVTLPLLLLLIDLWPLNRLATSGESSTEHSMYPKVSGSRLVIEKIPLLLISLIVGIITIRAQGTARAFEHAEHLSLVYRTGNAVQALFWYFGKTLLPTQLTVMYPHPRNNLDWSWVVLCFVVVAGISLFVLLNRKQRPHLWFGWSWFVIALLPVIGLLQVGAQAYADRYSYVPQMGLLVMIVWEIDLLLCSFSGNQTGKQNFQVSPVLENRNGVVEQLSGSWMSTLSLILGAAGCFCLTVPQVKVWRTTETLWANALSIDPNNWYAQMQAGFSDLGNGLLDSANRRFSVVFAIRPELKTELKHIVWVLDRHAEGSADNAKTHIYMGLFFAHQLNRMPQAIEQFHHALKLEPENLSAKNNLALALSALGRTDEAEKYLREVLTANPNDGNAHVNLGVILENAGKLDSARDHYAIAVSINPSDQEAQRLLEKTRQALSNSLK